MDLVVIVIIITTTALMKTAMTVSACRSYETIKNTFILLTNQPPGRPASQSASKQNNYLQRLAEFVGNKAATNLVVMVVVSGGGCFSPRTPNSIISSCLAVPEKSSGDAEEEII